MEKEREDGDDLPPELNRIKEQIEKERIRHIHKKFELKCKPSVATSSSHHETLALVRCGEEDNNGRDNNKLLSRMQTQLRGFSNDFIYESDYDDDLLDDDIIDHKNDDDESIVPTIKLPYVEQLPKSITWVFVDSNQLMGEGESVMDKIQYYYEDDDIELSSDDEDGDEEFEKEKYQFSENADRFIWKVGQEHGFNDVVTQSALTKFFQVDLSDILERFNDLKLKNEESVGEASDSRSKSIITIFQAATNRHYCRRCLEFGCRTHEKSQPEIKPRDDDDDDEFYFSENEDDRNQCSEHCYLKARSVTKADHVVNNDNSISNNKGKNVISNTITEDNAVNNANAEMSIWTPEEKDLYLKALEIYGRNSCLIAKNAFWELKTCLEVHNYMREQDQRTMLFGYNLAIKPKPKDQSLKRKIELRKRLHHHKNLRLRKLVRRRPRALRKAANTEQKSYKVYTPCTCDSICGDQCPCYSNDNCCEKYCGCSKECNNRYGGCTCVTGQCVNRHCLCFTANRECDPDLCQNCCLSCGETSEQIKCNNMRSLFKKHKKILIAKSDIHGWGAFTRYSLKKNEYLGEYTGEMITHAEADQRGIVEAHLGTSYLFTLNDQFEIDSRRKGNKLKFLNHSAKPNCYVKLMIVRGDNRIGLFAMKDIEEGEELFFDYNYGPEQAEWSRGRKFRKSVGSNKLHEVGPSSYQSNMQ